MVTTSEIFYDTRILDEANTLAKKYQVTILAKKYDNQSITKRYPFKIKIIDYKIFKNSRINIFSAFWSLMIATFKEQPEIYHAHDLDGLLCTFLAAVSRRKKLIYDAHEVWSNTYPFSNLKGIRWVLAPLEKFLMMFVYKGITVNGSISRYLSNKYHKEFISIQNIPNLNRGNKRISLKKLYPDKKIILHLGAADEGRGLEQMVHTFKYLPKNYLLIFIGGGKTELDIKKMSQRLHLDCQIKFLPKILPDQIIDSIKEADLGLALTQKISLSYYLSLPNKIFQYILAELPILCSNFPEFKNIVLKENIGETVNPANPKEIAKQILKIIKNKNNYQKNYKNIQNKYTWGKESIKLLKFYKNIQYNI